MEKTIIKIHAIGFEGSEELSDLSQSLDIKSINKYGFGGIEDLMTIFILEVVKNAAKKTINKIEVFAVELYKSLQANKTQELQEIIVTIEHEGDELFKKTLRVEELSQLPQIVSDQLKKDLNGQ
ncbi:MAG: hypothetical protein ABJF04_18020 [Reichenbachiella sp.]|uniref:hypothetical protein n=1 Tax=Reichenbachiella sp. TaxID=2184521 RepID=UPI0032664F24